MLHTRFRRSQTAHSVHIAQSSQIFFVPRSPTPSPAFHPAFRNKNKGLHMNPCVLGRSFLSVPTSTRSILTSTLRVPMRTRCIPASTLRVLMSTRTILMGTQGVQPSTRTVPTSTPREKGTSIRDYGHSLARTLLRATGFRRSGLGGRTPVQSTRDVTHSPRARTDVAVHSMGKAGPTALFEVGPIELFVPNSKRFRITEHRPDSL